MLIVLNTMIGSVYERRREISIYTSVGLAPSHVAFLFIAEALAFAVLSVVLGYLVAQIFARLFGATTLWQGITVNYSSLAGVAAMLLVMSVVLASVIYPSRVAAQIAIPDVRRAWTLPAPQGNVLEATLPFLMKYGEHEGLGGYMLSYFQSHQDISHGPFSAGAVQLVFVCPEQPAKSGQGQAACRDARCCRDACLHLHLRVWLAPFDFGIMQRVDVQFCPAAGEEQYLEIKVRLEREAGELSGWKRMNKIFLHGLRKQLLAWRSLDAAARERYAKMLAAEQVKTSKEASTSLK